LGNNDINVMLTLFHTYALDRDPFDVYLKLSEIVSNLLVTAVNRSIQYLDFYISCSEIGVAGKLL